MAIYFVSLCFNQNDREELAFDIESGEVAVVDSCRFAIGLSGVGLVGEAAEGFCDAVGGDFCDSASFAGLPVNGFVL